MEFNEFVTFNEALGSLDPMVIDGTSYTPRFMYGSETDMLVYLNQKRKTGETIYPLIWIETPLTLEGNPNAEAEVNILLATLTTSTLSNIQRTDLTFATTLDPLLEVVKKALNGQEGMKIIAPENEKVTKHFNYDTNSTTQGSDIWDAIKYECTIRFNLNCI